MMAYHFQVHRELVTWALILVTIQCSGCNSRSNNTREEYYSTVVVNGVEVPDGDAKAYDGQGNLLLEGQYKEGRRVGHWKYYSEGEVVSTEEWEDGRLLSWEGKYVEGYAGFGHSGLVVRPAAEAGGRKFRLSVYYEPLLHKKSPDIPSDDAIDVLAEQIVKELRSDLLSRTPDEIREASRSGEFASRIQSIVRSWQPKGTLNVLKVDIEELEQ